MGRPRDPENEQQRREAIAAATIALLTEGSYDRMTLGAVAQRAGVSKGLVNYYFDGKDALILEAIRFYHQTQQAAILGLVWSDLPVVERLELMIEAAFPTRQSVLDEVRFQVEVFSFAKSRPAAWAVITESYRTFRTACQAVLDVGVSEGVVSREDAEWLYLFVHALVDGLTFQVAVDPDLDLAAAKAQALRVIQRMARPETGTRQGHGGGLTDTDTDGRR